MPDSPNDLDGVDGADDGTLPAPLPAAASPAALIGTEQANARHTQLDRYNAFELVNAFLADQALAAAAVQAAAIPLARAVDAALPRVRAGGRLLYVGAGTSGRLGVLDSAELPPTFSWPNERAIGVLAGGRGAMFVSAEGAEDDKEQGHADLAAHSPGPLDVVIGIAASGTTPYVLGALRAGRLAGALTIGLANNPGTPVLLQAQIGIVLDTGPELISGSTRLKAGTAQKIALNTFSSSLMVRLQKVYGNLMVDVRASNAKLRQRALRLTQQISGAETHHAEEALAQCGQRVKVAIVMLRLRVDVNEAEARLEAAEGSVHRALEGDEAA